MSIIQPEGDTNFTGSQRQLAEATYALSKDVPKAVHDSSCNDKHNG